VARAVVSYPNRGERVYWYAGVWLDVLLVVFLEFTSISCCASSAVQPATLPGPIMGNCASGPDTTTVAKGAATTAVALGVAAGAVAAGVCASTGTFTRSFRHNHLHSAVYFCSIFLGNISPRDSIWPVLTAGGACAGPKPPSPGRPVAAAADAAYAATRLFLTVSGCNDGVTASFPAPALVRNVYVPVAAGLLTATPPDMCRGSRRPQQAWRLSIQPAVGARGGSWRLDIGRRPPPAPCPAAAAADAAARLAKLVAGCAAVERQLEALEGLASAKNAATARQRRLQAKATAGPVGDGSTSAPPPQQGGAPTAGQRQGVIGAPLEPSPAGWFPTPTQWLRFGTSTGAVGRSSFSAGEAAVQAAADWRTKLPACAGIARLQAVAGTHG
jgi:hypothetical protein